MLLTLDQERFAYRGRNGLRAFCRLRVYEEQGRAPVVVASETGDNPGPSVTDSVAQIGALAWQLLEKPEAGIVFIQHYPNNNDAGQERAEEFALVHFNGPRYFENPDWLSVPRPIVEAMLNGAAL